MSDNDWVAGESDPNDFTAEEVVDAIAASDATEVERIKTAEAAGKDRVTVANAEGAPSPTSPTPATLAAQPPSGPSEDFDVHAPVADPGPQVGDVVEDDAASPIPEGYTEVVVSTDGMPTEATEASEAAKAEEPLVY